MHNWRPGETITAAKLRSGYASGTAIIPFSSGATLIEPSSSSSVYAKNYWRQSVQVLFPVGRFTSPPVVTLGSSTTVPGVLIESSVVNITATGCEIRGARASEQDTPICWVAVEDSGA